MILPNLSKSGGRIAFRRLRPSPSRVLRYFYERHMARPGFNQVCVSWMSPRVFDVRIEFSTRRHCPE